MVVRVLRSEVDLNFGGSEGFNFSYTIIETFAIGHIIGSHYGKRLEDLDAMRVLFFHIPLLRPSLGAKASIFTSEAFALSEGLASGNCHCQLPLHTANPSPKYYYKLYLLIQPHVS